MGDTPAKVAKVANPAPHMCTMRHVGLSAAGPFFWCSQGECCAGDRGAVSGCCPGRCLADALHMRLSQGIQPQKRSHPCREPCCLTLLTRATRRSLHGFTGKRTASIYIDSTRHALSTSTLRDGMMRAVTLPIRAIATHPLLLPCCALSTGYASYLP